MKKREVLTLLLFSILLLLAFTGCSQTAEKPITEEEKPLIIATLFPQYDFVKQIAGDKVSVTLLLPPGVEPHSYEPSPRDIVDIQKADMFVYTGAYMEPWAERIIDAAEGTALLIVDTSMGIDLMDEDDHHLDSLIMEIDHLIQDWEDGKLTVVETLEAIEHLLDHFFEDHDHSHDDDHGHDNDRALELVRQIDHLINDWEEGKLSADGAFETIDDLVHRFIEEHGGDHDHGGKDPHFWLDPLLAQVMADHIIEGLVHIDPDNEGYYRQNGEAYKQQLQGLHDKIESSLAGLENRTILYAGHFAFGYFAARYDLDHVSPYEGFAPDAEPTPGNIAELIKRVSESEAKVIFYEELIEPKIAVVVAEQTGAEMILLHGAHNVTTEELNNGVTYIQIMEDNLAKLLEGLQ